MAHWIRYEREGETGFGTLDGEVIEVFSGDMFAAPQPAGRHLPLASVRLRTPCLPSKIVALWNNSRSLAAKQNLSEPAEPLFFLKGPNAYLPSGTMIRKPAAYDGPVFYEAELGVVIKKTCKEVGVDEAEDFIFGYTCVNDVTAFHIISEEPTFPQWTRAKSFDGFAPFGPCIATDTPIAEAVIQAELNRRQRQNYPVSDLFKQPAALVSALSRCMTLFAGDIISCGTGPGSLPMKPGSTIDIVISGIGRLSNTYET